MTALRSHFLIFAINLAALGILYWQIDHVDIELQYRKIASVDQVKTIDLQLDREIFRLNSNHLKNYDTIVDLQRRRNQALESLQRDADAGRPAPGGRRLVETAKSRAKRGDLAIDRILRAHSQLRNSEAYFPGLIRDLVDQSRSAAAPSDFGSALYRLRDLVAIHTFEQTDSSEQAIIRQTDALRGNHGQGIAASPEVTEDFENALEHARIIAIQTVRLRELIEIHLGLTLSALADQIHQHYASWFVREQEQAESLFPLFYLVQFVLVGHIFVLFTQLIRTNRQISGQARALQINLEREQELNSLQRQFVSMVSHEFRTPLAIIDSSAQRLLRRPDKATPERLTGSMGKIRNSVRRLVNLMESVLNVARIEEGRIELSLGEFDLKGLVGEIAEGYQEVSSDHRIALEIDHLPSRFRGDSTLLGQVVSNLISNAVKYSPSGTSVAIQGKVEAGQVQIAVSDEGVGIPPEEVKKLFQRFFRASTSTGIPGSGIGLHLVRHLVELHGGRIEVESTVGEGTRFTAHLPMAVPEGQAAESDPEQSRAA